MPFWQKKAVGGLRFKLPTPLRQSHGDSSPLFDSRAHAIATRRVRPNQSVPSFDFRFVGWEYATRVGKFNVANLHASKFLGSCTGFPSGGHKFFEMIAADFGENARIFIRCHVLLTPGLPSDGEGVRVRKTTRVCNAQY
jgi:hypothetical protein